MRPLANSSAPALDPPTLPQASFARADDFLNRAGQLRAKAQLLTARANENEEYAARLEKCAAEIQANAEEDREYVQNELDHTLEYHGDVLKHFLLMSENENEVEKLTTRVEEGRAYMHEVICLGEKLLHFRAANLGSNEQIELNSPTVLSTARSTASSSSEIPFLNYASLPSPFTCIGGRSTWRSRISSFLSNRVPGAIPPAASPCDSEGPRAISAAEALGSESNAPENSVSTEALQGATVPRSHMTTAPGFEGKAQTRRKEERESATVKTVALGKGGTQVHQALDYVPKESSQAHAPTTNQRVKKTRDLNHNLSKADRRKKSAPTKEEKAACFDAERTLARYRQLISSIQGPHDAKTQEAADKVKKDMRQKVRSNRQMSHAKMERLIHYGTEQIKAMISSEKSHIPTNPSNTNGQPPNMLKRKMSEPALAEPAIKKRKEAQPPAEIEKEDWFNETDALAEYRKAFAEAMGDVGDKRAQATVVISKALNDSILSDGRIASYRKPQFFDYVAKKIDAMANKEIKQAARAEEGDARLGGIPKELAEDTTVVRGVEGGDSGGLADLCAAELSDEFVDDSQYP